MEISSYSAFLFDVDKTLTNSSRVVTAHTKESIANLLSLSYIAGVCTGRHYATLRNFGILSSFPESSRHVVSGGAQIIDSNGEVYWQKVIEASTSHAILDEAQRLGIVGYTQSENSIFGNEKAFKGSENNSSVHDLLPLATLSDWDVPIIMAYGYTQQFIEFIDNQNVEYKKMTNYNGTPYVDITSKGISKRTGVLEWCRMQHIEPSQIIGFGDSENDDFLSIVGYAVGMGNATDAVKNIADEITASCDEDGVAVWIDRTIAHLL